MRHGGRGGPVERYFSGGEITLHWEVKMVPFWWWCKGGPVVRYFSGREICSLSIELPVCKAWRKVRPCGKVF